MATIKYKGEEKEIAIDNRTLLAFEMKGGDFNQFNVEPVTAAITLACAALGLEGNILDHANDLPPLAELVEVMKDAMQESGFGDENMEGNE